MAAFGLPGGAEWLFIILIVVLLAGGPAVIGFLLGFFVGKKSGADTPGASTHASQPVLPGSLAAPAEVAAPVAPVPPVEDTTTPDEDAAHD